MPEINYKIEELLPIVEELTIKYTSNESSSITYEAARTLMSAVIYCINERSTGFEDKSNRSNTSVEIYNSIKPAKEAYEKGYKLVIEKVKKAIEVYNNIMSDFRFYENMAYFDTIVKGMPAFFQYYDAKFNPQNHILTLDYPILKSVEHLSGVDAIYQYLFYISLEQTFLKAFSEDVIIDLLRRFDENHYELFINICSISLENAIGCFIARKQISALKLEKRDFYSIRKFAEGKSKSEFEKEISKTIRMIIEHGYSNNECLYEYLLADVSDFAVRLLNAVENDCLETIFPL